MPLKKKIVRLRAIAAPDDVDVARAARDDQRGLCSRSFDQRVDGNGRAVNQLVDCCGSKRALADAIDDALHQVRRGGEALRLHEASCRIVEADQIREGAADIDSNDDHAGKLRWEFDMRERWPGARKSAIVRQKART